MVELMKSLAMRASLLDPQLLGATEALPNKNYVH